MEIDLFKGRGRSISHEPEKRRVVPDPEHGLIQKCQGGEFIAWDTFLDEESGERAARMIDKDLAGDSEVVAYSDTPLPKGNVVGIAEAMREATKDACRRAGCRGGRNCLKKRNRLPGK